MAEATLRTSGLEVFNGNTIILNQSNSTWNFKRLISVPPLPGTWKPAETDSLGFVNPTITIKGLMNLQNTHGTNESNSLIDFQFLNEFVGSSGLKYYGDDVIKPSSGSEFLVDILSWQFTQKAKQTSSPNVRQNAQSYTLDLVVASGTPWYSGTGIDV